jgi:hypothetical protein
LSWDFEEQLVDPGTPDEDNEDIDFDAPIPPPNTPEKG